MKIIFLVFLSLIWLIIIHCHKDFSSVELPITLINPEILYTSESFYPLRLLTLTLIDANGNNRREIFSTRGHSFWDPTFSDDGKSIIFVMIVDSIGTALYKIDLDGKNLLKISENQSNYTYTYENPQMLPDRKNVVYMKRVDLKNHEIRILNIETKEDRQLVSGKLNRLYPEITGDGQWIIFWKDFNLYKYHITGNEKYKITNGNAFPERFNLNKRTNEIVFRSYNPQIPGEKKIAKINIDGSNYIKYDFGGQYPDLSNDGAHILFVAMGNNKPSIWIANSDGSNLQIVTSHYTWDDFVQFYPSSRKILFVRRNLDRALFSCDFNGDDLTQLTPFDHTFSNCPKFRP